MQRKWNVVIARDAFFWDDFANPYSFFIAFSLDYMLVGWQSVLNCLRYHDVARGVENEINPRGELHAALCPA